MAKGVTNRYIYTVPGGVKLVSLAVGMVVVAGGGGAVEIGCGCSGWEVVPERRRGLRWWVRGDGSGRGGGVVVVKVAAEGGFDYWGVGTRVATVVGVWGGGGWVFGEVGGERWGWS